MNASGVTFSIWTIMIGHATFCVVVVFNNVIARLRRTSGSIVEARSGARNVIRTSSVGICRRISSR